MAKRGALSVAAGLALFLSGCLRGALPQAIPPLVAAPRAGDADRVKDGFRGPVWSVRVSAPDGRWRAQSEYDRAGRILHRVDEQLEQWYRYDTRGVLLERIERATPLAQEPLASRIQRTEFEYDAAGRLSVETRYGRDGEIIQRRSYEYDAAGRRVAETEQAGTNLASVTKHFGYDDQGRQIAEISGDGSAVTFRRYDAGNRVLSASYRRAAEPGPFPTPSCPWPAELRASDPLPTAQEKPAHGRSPLPGVLPLLRFFGYHPEASAFSFVLSDCHAVITDQRGYELEDSTPDGSVCWRYNSQGDEIVKEKREHVAGCGRMLTLFTPYTYSETRYEYDAWGNWTHRWSVTTSYAEAKTRTPDLLPLVRSRSEYESIRAISYFADAN